MTPTGACKDPSRWRGVVIDWLDYRLLKLNARCKPKAIDERPKPKRKSFQPASRFQFFLDTYLRLASKNPKLATEDQDCAAACATAIVSAFYFWTKEGRTIDPRILSFIDKAHESYCRDPKRNIGRALGLVRERRGNPGRVPTAKRRLTLDGFDEAGKMATAIRQGGKPEGYAVDIVANLWGVSPRTVRAAAAQEQLAQKLAEMLENNEKRETLE